MTRTRKEKADRYCSWGIILFIVFLISLAVLAASTAKMVVMVQVASSIAAAASFVASMVMIYLSIKMYDGR